MPHPAVSPRDRVADQVAEALTTISPLRASAVAPATLHVYRAAVLRFASFCKDRDLCGLTSDDFDRAMEAFILSTYQDDPSRGAKSRMACSVMGAELFLPQHRKKLVGSRLALKGWDRLVPRKSPPPISFSILNGIACECERRGLAVYNIAFRMQFHCYLRASELLQLRVSDVSLPGDVRLSHWGQTSSGGIRLVDTKTGPEQFVTLSDPVLSLLLPTYISSRLTQVGQSGRLFPVSYEQLRRLFHAALGWLSLDVPFTLHSIRHGGATHDSLQGMPVSEIVKRGRWTDPRSASTYLQTGRALFLSVSIPRSTLHRLDVYHRATERLVQMGGTAAELH